MVVIVNFIMIYILILLIMILGGKFQVKFSITKIFTCHVFSSFWDNINVWWGIFFTKAIDIYHYGDTWILDADTKEWQNRF